jgi:hypothetical protein
VFLLAWTKTKPGCGPEHGLFARPNFSILTGVTGTSAAERGGGAPSRAAKESNVMFTHFKSGCALLALTCLALGSLPGSASAITAEVAKKCNALTAKQFPPREPGNPAAGSAKGSGRDQRAYFSKCVANNGIMDDTPAK